MLDKFLLFIKPPDFGDEEKNRIAEILNVIALSIFSGFLILVLQRAIAGDFTLFIPILFACISIIISIVFLRIGHLQWAEAILLWSLLGFITFLLYNYEGLHSIALLGIPVCLVFAAVALRDKYFYAYTLLSITAIILIGFGEISGDIVNPFSKFTDLASIIDIAVILAVTAIAVRILANNFLKSIHQARANEKEIRLQSEELKESEEKFRTLTEELPNLVFIIKNNRIIYVNEKCEELIGYLREELYSENFDFLSIVAPEHREFVMYKFGQQFSEEEVEPYENTLIGKNGEQIECLQMTKLIHYEGEPAILSLVTDLTEFKRAQEEIRTSQMRLSSIITSAMEAIITIDKNRNIQSFNPAAEHMFLCTETEAIGLPIERFIVFPRSHHNNNYHNNNIDSSNQDSIVDVLEGRVRVISGIRINGESFPAEASIAKVFTGKEEIYTVILRDITERIKSEENQRNLQAQLLQSQKMEAVGSLAGGIAHDFNNILSVIIGNAELVKLKLNPKHRAMKHIDEVLTGADRAQELVQQILAFSRKQDTNFRPVRLHYVLREGMKLIRASIPSTIEIKVELPISGPLVLGDATQIHQVLMNLCTNAAHAMEDRGGKLLLKQKSIEFDDKAVLFHPDLKNGRYVMFSVQDTGHGMDGFTLKRIFEPFFTTKTHGKGTGLGLSIVHAIIKNHGGAIKVQSQIEKGTQIEVYLPEYDGEDEIVKLEKSLENSGSLERIMIIDDEPQLLETLTEITKGLGYQAFPFTTSNEALEAFEKNPNGFDLIITDHTMPHMTGITLTSKILQLKKDIPIVLMTGYDQLESPEKLESLGIKSVLLKPFKKHVLGETIRKVLKKSDLNSLEKQTSKN